MNFKWLWLVLVLCSGCSNKVKVIDVRGMNYDDAIIQLEQAGLSVIVYYVDSEEVLDQQALNTVPMAGSLVEPGSSIELYARNDLAKIVPKTVVVSNIVTTAQTPIGFTLEATKIDIQGGQLLVELTMRSTCSDDCLITFQLEGGYSEDGLQTISIPYAVSDEAILKDTSVSILYNIPLSDFQSNRPTKLFLTFYPIAEGFINETTLEVTLTW